TFGAAAGSLLAALVLIPGIGNIRTTLVIASINVAIGVFAMVMSSRSKDALPTPEVLEKQAAFSIGADEIRSSNPTADRLVLGTLAVSGFVSMMHEVSWTRALSAIIGSSTYAFSIMLVTFLIGIALGSSIISRRKPAATLRLLGLMQLGVAIGGGVCFLAFLGGSYAMLTCI